MRIALLLAVSAIGGCATGGTPTAPIAMACPIAVNATIHPQPEYPLIEAREGYEDACLVRFDVDASARP